MFDELGRHGMVLTTYAPNLLARVVIAGDLTFHVRRPGDKCWFEIDDSDEVYEVFFHGLPWEVGDPFALMLYTGQRRSDVHRMTWADVSDTTVEVVQQKTGRPLIIGMHRELRAVLAAAPREHVTILNTAYGKPFTVDGFSQWMRDAITAAGLPLECQPHGLRKAAGRRLDDAGCTAHEIMAVLGHTTLAEAERYTREADQVRLASSAVIKLEGHNRNGVAQTTPARFGKTAKNSRKP